MAMAQAVRAAWAVSYEGGPSRTSPRRSRREWQRPPVRGVIPRHPDLPEKRRSAPGAGASQARRKVMTTGSASASECVREVLEQIAAGIGVEAAVRLTEEQDGVTAEFVGEDLGLLIGHHGQTIDAIQHLAYRIAFRRRGEPLRVVVDAAGYRERRAVALRAAADQAAEAAIHDRRPVALEAMSAQERKVVHEHLKTRHDVETYSEGQEPERRLVVAPLVG
jgi:spoIIIJ-associated protein